MENIIGKPYKTQSSILLISGKYLDILDPQPESIEIEDIARGLSRQARFGGHSNVMYTVAQHSIECSLLVSNKYKIQALLHDASEAYIGDIPTPFKNHLPDYLNIEFNLMKVIGKKYGFEWPVSDDVDLIDKYLFQLEWNQFTNGDKIITIPTNNFNVMTIEESEKEFLKYFKIYTRKNENI